MLLPLRVVTPSLLNIVAFVSSPVFTPVRLLPVMEPDAVTLSGVIFPRVTVILGVVEELATETDTPFAVTPVTLVTVPAAFGIPVQYTFVPLVARI